MKGAGKYVLSAAGAVGLLCSVGGMASANQATPSEEVSPAQAQDAKLEKRIDYRLQHDQRLKNRDVDASVSEGTVTLTGTVNSSAEKARAERLARAKGVVDVENQIEVQKPGEQGGTSTVPIEQQQQQGQMQQPQPGGEAQGQTQQPGGEVKERSTRVEERTETRIERGQQQPAQEEQGTTTPPPSAPSEEERVPSPSAPRPTAPAPVPEPMPPQRPSSPE